MAKSVPIAARIDADLDGELERLAEATGRSKSWLVNEALRSYVASEQQFLAAVEEGNRPCGTVRLSIMQRLSRHSSGWLSRSHDDHMDPTGA